MVARTIVARQEGIALLEALIAILIFSFGVLGLIALEASAINFAADAEDRNRAAMIAGEVASDMWTAGTVNTGNAQLAAQIALWQTNISNPTTTGLTNGTLVVTDVAGTTNSANITITWKPPYRAATSAVSSLTTRVTLP
jgi:type IV pilus assembly protein PilV